MMNKTILVIGTYDTKDDELGFLAEVIQAQGGQVVKWSSGHRGRVCVG